ncbi:putative glutamate racemase [Magnetofaba australis IT-1]|uniref:Glutamate racemase n=1 Tax=Magnetofaba australis IT-1 TaxID=1434232 RepID=A0A1Y2K2P3_9PROT|nr:putative glutamate racemase [Magnetofaba australis IT-1]
MGDTARVPYGTKSARTVERYTIQVASVLEAHEVKALVVACNTASALGLAALRAHTALPALGVIQPGCRAALSATRSGRIGVIGTRTTIASGAYRHSLFLMQPKVTVADAPCPLFVPLAEEGWTDHPASHLIIEESLAPLKQHDIDALILGCTHYPVLKQAIGKVMGPEIALVDSAHAVADDLADLMPEVVRPTFEDAQQQLRYLVTDEADRFTEVARRFLHGFPIERAEMVDL